MFLMFLTYLIYYDLKISSVNDYDQHDQAVLNRLIMFDHGVI